MTAAEPGENEHREDDADDDASSSPLRGRFERDVAARPDCTQREREIARDICTRLDGIPLAIELAAARVRVLTPEQIAARLEDRFAILTSGVRTTIPRHRTLRAAIDWSFALLTFEEQTLLARLSIFAGSFSLEATELICEADLDRLTGLVDKSLVVTTSRRATLRFTCCTVPARPGWAPRISRASGGGLSVAMTSSSRWMRTAPIGPSTCRCCWLNRVRPTS